MKPKTQLPPPCEKCAPDGLWIYTGRGMKRCDCPRGRMLAERDATRCHIRADAPGITSEQAAIAVEQLGALMIVPASDVARLAITREFTEFICDAEELAWMVREAPRHYRDWPGIRELRALYCSMFDPKDGITVDSIAFEDGYAEVSEPAAYRKLDAPRGGQISADANGTALVRTLAGRNVITEVAPPNRRIYPEPAEKMQDPATWEPPSWSDPPAPKVKAERPAPATQEELDQIKAQQEANRKERQP